MLQIVLHTGLHSHQQSQWGTSERHFETLEHSRTILIGKKKMTHKIKRPETLYLKLVLKIKFNIRKRKKCYKLSVNKMAPIL